MFCLKPSLFLEICKKLSFSGCHQKVYHRFMYIAPSSDHSLLTPNLPFKVILREFEVVFWCLEWECCTFQKIDENSFKSTNTIKVLHVWLKGQWFLQYDKRNTVNSAYVEAIGTEKIACQLSTLKKINLYVT